MGLALARYIVALPLCILAYAICKVIYNVLLHPNRAFPGPLLARATVITSQRKLLQGQSHKWLQSLHQVYGPVVRFAPNELSFIEPEVWKDVYGHRTTSSFQKTKEFYGPDPIGNPPGLIRADDVHHAFQRRLVSHAFSDKALKEQEPLLKKYAMLLIERLQEEAAASRAVSIVDWYNFTTFDIMGDLTFGESLGQLSSAAYSPWVKAGFSFLKILSISRICRAWPGLTRLLQAMLPADAKKKRKMHVEFSKERVDKRMAQKTDRPDIWTFVTRFGETEGKSLAPTELHSNGTLFMLAGTETTATELSGLTYLLLKNPEKLERLVKEVRGAFSSSDDMTMTKLSQLEYLNACLEEGLRMYPPLPVGLARSAPAGGAKVCNRWVAGGTVVQAPIYSMNYSPLNWTEPDLFAPERWLPEGRGRFPGDKKEALNPFSFGPRNCLGKNLAYHEMRLILASILLHFDLELQSDNGTWLEQDMHIIWDKKALMVNLSIARKG